MIPPSPRKGVPSFMEGRESLRFPFLGSNRLAVQVTTDEGEQRVGHAEDLSIHGIGIVLDRPLALEMNVLVHLSNSTSGSGYPPLELEQVIALTN